MKKNCVVKGCNKPIHARELCSMHYQYQLYHKNLEYRTHQKEWRQRPEIKEWHNIYMKKRRVRPEMKEWLKKKRKEDKIKALTHYGGNPPKCACCGEDKIEFLSIDHINGGGRKHREALKVGGFFNKWLIKNDFPEGYRVLCFNCNLSLGFHGYCPHQKSNDSISS